MRLQDVTESITANGRAATVHGQPYETADGTTIVSVAKVRSRHSRDGEPVVTAEPTGAYVIRGDSVQFVPSVDATRVALMGELIGLVAATFLTLAILRRPPWPDLRPHAHR